MNESHPRRIRSFVRRPGRLTPSQARALDELWPDYGLEPEGPVDLSRVFGRRAKIVLEIGYGNGETLVRQAADDAERDYLGIEVHEPGVGHCLLAARDSELTNLRLIRRDAVDVMRDSIADGALSRINLYFPDPWPKKRHHKRRILNEAFLALAAQKLAPSGALCIATDWAGYAEHIEELLEGPVEFDVDAYIEHGGDRPLDRSTTKFERRGLARGHRIHDWRLLRR